MKPASGWAAAAVLFLLLTGLTGLQDAGEPALSRGNRLFQGDDIEGALDAYARGWRGDGSRTDGLLAYNAGTSAHRFGRLPEALLWYRRAETALPGDPWLHDNLALTRHALGDPPAKALAGWTWLADRRPFAFLGVALAWAGLLLLVLPRHPPRMLLALVAVLSCAAFLAGSASRIPGRALPRAAVLLAPCPAKNGLPALPALPAGSEVWVRPVDGGGWRIAGDRGGVRCPLQSVGLVDRRAF